MLTKDDYFYIVSNVATKYFRNKFSLTDLSFYDTNFQRYQLIILKRRKAIIKY